MKYIKASFIITIIILFIYYKFNKDNSILFEDKLSMFVLIESHDNIDDILLDLSSQIESFDEHVHNVYYSKDNDFLIRNKLKSQFDIDYVDYKTLLNSSNLIDFNNRAGKIIEDYFLDNHSSLYLTKKYLLRDFLTRFYGYFKYQVSLFNKENVSFESKTPVEDFVLGSKYVSNYEQEYYMMRIEFLDLESIINYEKSGLDSIFNSILDYNSKTFNSKLFFHNPYVSKLSDSKFDFKLKQYVKEFTSINQAIDYHKNLMLSDNVVLVESIYDYYFSNINNLLVYEASRSLKLHSAILDSNYYINKDNYKNSLFSLEEKLIALQSDDLTDDPVVTAILYNLIGDGGKKGIYSEYIDLITPDSDYIVNNLNRLFSYELQSLFERVDQAEKEFDISIIPLEIKKHLYPDNLFKVRYFIEE